MRTTAYIVAMLLACVLAASAQNVASNEPARKPHLITEYNLPGLDKKVSLDVLDAMDVVDLIKFLAMKGELNVVLGREITGTSKLLLKDVTLGQALEIVLAANNLAYEVKGNIVKVMTDKDYRDLYGEGFYEQKQAKVVKLQYAMPSNVAKMLDNIKSGIGKIVFDDGTGNLVLIDTPAKIREMEEVIQKSELPTVQRVLPTVTTNFVLQYAKVEDIEAQVKPLLTKDGGKEVGEIRTDKRTKTIIVTDLPAAMQKIADLVAIFDRAPKQVFIEAKIVEVKLTDEFRLGVKWDHVLEGLGPRFALQSASQFSPLAPMAAGGSLSYNTIAAGGDLNVVLNALATAGDTKVLSNPHIAALDGEEATIKVVTTQPYAETTYESGSTNVVGKSYKFVDVGVTLGVTPRINEMGFITMSIKPEVSSADTFYDSAGGQGVPVVKKQYAETSVSVKDGITIIIAGMITEQKEKTVAKVPFLGSIPVLGILFRSEEVKAQNTETVVLLTPRIVSGTKFFERSKDIKKPTKSEGGPEADAVALDKTP